MDEEIKKYELEKIRLEVKKLSKEINTTQGINYRGWFTTIITVISIVTGFFGIYTSYNEMKQQREEEQRFSFNADMLEIIKEGDEDKLNLQTLIYFGHNAVPLLISIMETEESNKEDAIKAITRIHSKQTSDIQQSVEDLLTESFQALDFENPDFETFEAYFQIFLKIKTELSESTRTKILDKSVALNETIPDDINFLLQKDKVTKFLASF
ncbi:MAG: hypothetical protein JXR03_00350 [Cyclobacteriaceae bacterium]